MARETLNLDIFVPALVVFVSNKLSRGASTTYRRLFGIGVTEWRIISLLAIEPNISAQRVCHVIGLNKALVSRAVAALETGRYVKSESDASDHRKRCLALTARGFAVHDRILKVALEREKILLAGFTPEEVTKLVEFLRRMHRKVDDVNAYRPSAEPKKRMLAKTEK
jgi:DNA-binding MarR family transcriptional regulator